MTVFDTTCNLAATSMWPIFFAVLRMYVILYPYNTYNTYIIT